MDRMSPLPDLFAKLIRGKTVKSVAESIDAGPSRETLRRVLGGASVKLSTLRDLAVGLHVSKAQWIEIVCAWARSEIGEDQKKISIRPRAGRTIAPSQLASATKLFSALPASERKQIIELMQDDVLLSTMATLSRNWFKLSSEKRTRRQR